MKYDMRPSCLRYMRYIMRLDVPGDDRYEVCMKPGCFGYIKL